MQYGKFEIQLGGEMQNTVIRDGLSPAEVEVLKLMHGDHSVRPIAITGDKKVSVDAEMERLRFRFKTKNAAKALNEIFPGSRPRLPINFEDIGIDDMPDQREQDEQSLDKALQKSMSEEHAKKVIEATKKAEAEEAQKAEKAKAAAAEAAKKAEKENKTDTKKTPKKEKTKVGEVMNIEYDD